MEYIILLFSTYLDLVERHNVHGLNKVFKLCYFLLQKICANLKKGK